MSNSENEQVVRDMIECIVKGDGANIGRYVAENWVNHDPILPPMSGIAGAKQLVGIWKGLSDMKLAIEDSFSQGDRVAMRFSLTGKHSGTVMGVSPTGKTIKVSAMGIFRVADGKATDNWVHVDGVSLLTQLGLVTPPKL